MKMIVVILIFAFYLVASAEPISWACILIISGVLK